MQALIVFIEGINGGYGTRNIRVFSGLKGGKRSIQQSALSIQPMKHRRRPEAFSQGSKDRNTIDTNSHSAPANAACVAAGSSFRIGGNLP